MAGTDVLEFLNEIDGGTLVARLSRMLSDCAAAASDHAPGKAQVTLTIGLKQAQSATEQVVVDVKAGFKHPTMIGDKAENVVTSVSMFVGARGALSLARPIQDGDMFAKRGDSDVG